MCSIGNTDARHPLVSDVVDVFKERELKAATMSVQQQEGGAFTPVKGEFLVEILKDVSQDP